jgi:hypothetical protein
MMKMTGAFLQGLVCKSACDCSTFGSYLLNCCELISTFYRNKLFKRSANAYELKGRGMKTKRI